MPIFFSTPEMLARGFAAEVHTATGENPDGLKDTSPLAAAQREISIMIRVSGKGIDTDGEPTTISGIANFTDPYAPELDQYIKAVRDLYGPQAPPVAQTDPEDEDQTDDESDDEDQDNDEGDYADPWEDDWSDDEDEDDQPGPDVAGRESCDPARYE